jgi:hypothetical protein
MMMYKQLCKQVSEASLEEISPLPTLMNCVRLEDFCAVWSGSQDSSAFSKINDARKMEQSLHFAIRGRVREGPMLTASREPRI